MQDFKHIDNMDIEQRKNKDIIQNEIILLKLTVTEGV